KTNVLLLSDTTRPIYLSPFNISTWSAAALIPTLADEIHNKPTAVVRTACTDTENLISEDYASSSIFANSSYGRPVESIADNYGEIVEGQCQASIQFSFFDIQPPGFDTSVERAKTIGQSRALI